MMALLTTENVDTEQARRIEVYEDTSTQFNIVAAPLYHATEQQWLDAHDLLMEKPSYRQRVKQLAKRVDNMWMQYEKFLRRAFGDRQPLLTDYCARCYGIHLEDDCDKMYYSIKRVLDRHGIDDSAFKARIVTAREMMAACQQYYTLFWDKASEIHGYQDMGHTFRYADLKPMLSTICSLTDIVAQGCKGQLLTSDNDCHTALMVIYNRLVNYDWLDEMGVDAMRLNVAYNNDLAEVIDDYDRRHQTSGTIVN